MHSSRRPHLFLAGLAVLLLAGALTPAAALPAPSKTAPDQTLAEREADLATVTGVLEQEEVMAVLAAQGFTREEANLRLAQLAPEEPERRQPGRAAPGRRAGALLDLDPRRGPRHRGDRRGRLRGGSMHSVRLRHLILAGLASCCSPPLSGAGGPALPAPSKTAPDQTLAERESDLATLASALDQEEVARPSPRRASPARRSTCGWRSSPPRSCRRSPPRSSSSRPPGMAVVDLARRGGRHRDRDRLD